MPIVEEIEKVKVIYIWGTKGKKNSTDDFAKMERK